MDYPLEEFTWKSAAKDFLLRHIEQVKLESLLKKLGGGREGSDISGIVDDILNKIKTPSELLSKQQISLAAIRFYISIIMKEKFISVFL
jgi:hypothetical protein